MRSVQDKQRPTLSTLLLERSRFPGTNRPRKSLHLARNATVRTNDTVYVHRGGNESFRVVALREEGTGRIDTNVTKNEDRSVRRLNSFPACLSLRLNLCQWGDTGGRIYGRAAITSDILSIRGKEILKMLGDWYFHTFPEVNPLE